jgi:hypothetical protein
MDRSEVAIKCKDKAYQMLINVCRKNNFMPDKVYEDDGEYILYWSWIKWFDVYTSVAEIERTLNQLNRFQTDEDAAYGYTFLRLGENDSDIETKSNDDSIELYTVHNIYIPDNLKELNDVC